MYVKGGIPVPEGPVSPGERPDNLWFQYDSLKVPRTREEYDSTIFIEKTHWGYYQWPKKLKTYMLHDESYKLGRTREELPEVLHQTSGHQLFLLCSQNWVSSSGLFVIVIAG